MSHREIAQRLGAGEAQVSRDERNEYHGITIERAQRVLEAMGESRPPPRRDESTMRGPSHEQW
jgi:hypothetical protein